MMGYSATHLNSTVSGVPVQTKLLGSLWTLANIKSFSAIEDRFGMYMDLYLENRYHCVILMYYTNV